MYKTAVYIQALTANIHFAISMALRWILTSVITARAVETSCCISNVPFQWENGNFAPPHTLHSSHIFDRSFWNSKLRNTSGTSTSKQNLVKIGRPQGLSEHRTPEFWPYIRGYLFYFLYSSLRVPVAPRTLRWPMRAQNACFRQGVAFRGS